MKKILIVAMCIALCFSLTACESEDSYQDGYDDGRYEGYGDGYTEALDDVCDFAENSLSDACYDIEEEMGMHPEEAIQTLTNYAIGEPVAEENLLNAIWVIEKYYNDVRDVVHDLDKDWIH